MLGFIYFIGRDIVRWSLITAGVLTYIELGPGGEALGNLVAMMVQTLMGIDWGNLAEQAFEQLSVLLDALVEALSSAAGRGNE